MYHIQKQLFRTPKTKPKGANKGAQIGFMFYAGEDDDAGFVEIEEKHERLLENYGWRKKLLANDKVIWFTFFQNEVNKVVRVLKNQLEEEGLSKKNPCGFVWFLDEQDIKDLDLTTIETSYFLRETK